MYDDRYVPRPHRGPLRVPPRGRARVVRLPGRAEPGRGARGRSGAPDTAPTRPRGPGGRGDDRPARQRDRHARRGRAGRPRHEGRGPRRPSCRSTSAARVKRGQSSRGSIPPTRNSASIRPWPALQQARARLGLPPDGTDDRVEPEKTALVRQARAVLDEARLTRERTERSCKQGLVARAQVDAADLGARASRKAGIRTRSRRCATGRPCCSSGAPSSSWRASSSPTPSSPRPSTARSASGGRPSASTSPPARPWRRSSSSTRCGSRLAVPEREAASVRVGQRVDRHRGGRGRASTRASVVRVSPGDRRAEPHAPRSRPRSRTRRRAPARRVREGRHRRRGRRARRHGARRPPSSRSRASRRCSPSTRARRRGARADRPPPGDRVEIVSGVAAGDAVVARARQPHRRPTSAVEQ